MADPDSFLAELYGQNYVDPHLGSDSVDYDTRNVSAAMANQQAAKEREPYEALVRLLTAWGMPMAAAAHRTASSSNLPKAISRHIAQEYKEGNQAFSPFTTPFLRAYLAVKTPAAHRWLVAYRNELDRGVNRDALEAIPQPSTGRLAGHAYSTARILEHLNRTEPKTYSSMTPPTVLNQYSDPRE